MLAGCRQGAWRQQEWGYCLILKAPNDPNSMESGGQFLASGLCTQAVLLAKLQEPGSKTWGTE